MSHPLPPVDHTPGVESPSWPLVDTPPVVDPYQIGWEQVAPAVWVHWDTRRTHHGDRPPFTIDDMAAALAARIHSDTVTSVRVTWVRPGPWRAEIGYGHDDGSGFRPVQFVGWGDTPTEALARWFTRPDTHR